MARRSVNAVRPLLRSPPERELAAATEEIVRRFLDAVGPAPESGHHVAAEDFCDGLRLQVPHREFLVIVLAAEDRLARCGHVEVFEGAGTHKFAAAKLLDRRRFRDERTARGTAPDTERLDLPAERLEPLPDLTDVPSVEIVVVSEHDDRGLFGDLAGAETV